MAYNTNRFFSIVVGRPVYLKSARVMKEVKHIIISEPYNAAGTRNHSSIHNCCVHLNLSRAFNALMFYETAIKYWRHRFGVTLNLISIIIVSKVGRLLTEVVYKILMSPR